ncbi:MAG TPA: ATP-binding protein [Woeseiaceae bacterium]|nr:ATP-binding protein [Woeseiaceae bacterium]
MTLRSHLLRLALLVLFPLALFGLGAILWIAERERDAFVEGAQQRTLALLTAVDTELAGHALRLHVLAASHNLHVGDLEAFRRQAMRVLPAQAGWRDIVLTLDSGEVLLSAAAAGEPVIGSAPAPGNDADRKTAAGPALTADEGVGNLADYGGEKLFTVHQPVRFGAEAAVLTAKILPSSILSLLTPQRLPVDWVGVVLDANGIIVARTRSHVDMLGRPAADSLRSALDRAPEGWFHGHTIEGDEVYTPYTRSRKTGWAVALGIPANVVEHNMNTSLLILVLGLLAALTVALVLAGLYSRYIAAPIVSLAAAAKAIGSGGDVRPLQRSRFREVRAVSQALVASGETIREREDKLRAADQAKDEFLAMLGHELRNPLGAMAAASQAIGIETRDGTAAREAAEAIARQVQRMTRLVDDLLNVGRVVSGKVSLKLAPIELAAAAEQVIDNLKKTSVLDGRDLETDLSPVWVSGDETRIEQILFNLLENAGKYTAPGARIAVRVAEENGSAVFRVADTGIGLAPGLLPRVFDLFAQGERSMDRGASGLGIGLTLVKQLTGMHGGTVTAASAGEGRGAEFTVRLPAIAPPAGRDAPAPEPVTEGNGRRVLLIEDNEDARRSMAAVLGHYGYRVFEAADGAAGIALAQEIHPGCAVVDIGLPQVDGYEVAARLRAMPACRGMLLIALTGYGGDEARRRAQDAGFDDYLVKPASPKGLMELIETRLGEPGDRTRSHGRP